MPGSNLDSSLASLGIRCAALAAGFAGALVSLYFAPPKPPSQLLAGLGVGVAAAVYITPLALEFMGPQPIGVENGVGFLVGLTAMNIIPAILANAQSVVTDPIGFLAKWRDRGHQ